MTAIALADASLASAAVVNGRFSVGAYLADENVSLPTSASGGNNRETLSGRAYLRVAGLSDARDEYVLDLRDKDDFFGATDRQNLTLQPANTLQVHQLSSKTPIGNSAFVKAGRFPVPQAGAVADGAEVGADFSEALQAAAFGGLNPRVLGQRFYEFHPNDSVAGAYLAYAPKLPRADRYFFANTAFVSEAQKSSDVDRAYWYASGQYQWSVASRLLLFSYVDFVPYANLQNGNLTWDQGIAERLSSSLNLLSVDAYEYVRLQGIRSLLPSSPYREASERLRFSFDPRFWIEARASAGLRSADDLSREEYAAVIDYSGFASHRWDVNATLGYVNDFQSVDQYVRFGFGYYGRKWEITAAQEARISTYSDAVYHPLTTDVDAGFSVGREFYFALGAQNVIDERVAIQAAYFKLTYRFGAGGFAPGSSGAPPKGRL